MERDLGAGGGVCGFGHGDAVKCSRAVREGGCGTWYNFFGRGAKGREGSKKEGVMNDSSLFWLWVLRLLCV